MLPLVPLTVFSFMPSGRPEPRATCLSKSGIIVSTASTLLASISFCASAGS